MRRWCETTTGFLASILYNYWLVFLLFRFLKLINEAIFSLNLLGSREPYLLDSHTVNPIYRIITTVLTISQYYMFCVAGFGMVDSSHYRTSKRTLVQDAILILTCCCPIIVFAGLIDGSIISVINPTFQFVEQLTSLLYFGLYFYEIWDFLHGLFISYQLNLAQTPSSNQSRKGTVTWKSPIPDE